LRNINRIITLSFFITLFERAAYTWIFALPYLRNLSQKGQILLFLSLRFLLALILFKGGVELGFLLMDELGEIIRPFFPRLPYGMPGEGGAAPGPNMPGLPGPSEPTALISAVPDSREMNRDSPSLSEEFPFLRMGSAEFRELADTLREPPLMEDSVRREELESFFRGWVAAGFEPKFDEGLVEMQFKLELKLEYALREDGFAENSIIETRRKWRSSALTAPAQARFLTRKALKRSLETANIRDSAPYKRVLRDVSNYQIDLTR